MFRRRWKTLIQFPDFFDKIMTKSLKFSDNPRENILAKHCFSSLHNLILKKIPFFQFQCWCSQARCTAWPRTTLIIGGRGKLGFATIFVWGCRDWIVIELHQSKVGNDNGNFSEEFWYLTFVKENIETLCRHKIFINYQKSCFCT